MDYEQAEIDKSLTGEGHISMCSASDCLYNENSRCIADGVIVSYHQTHADCNTYTRNQHIPGVLTEEIESG